MLPKPTVISYLRYSTPEQAKGDTVRRQLADSEEWAAERGLTIDSRLKDPGISGYSGANVEPTAALGRLLEQLKNGVIKKGTILLVESLDRLSRQDILPALNIFTTLLNSGLKVVTLADGKEYDAVSVTKNPMDLMFSVMVFARGNEESATKAGRVSKAWRDKQANAKTMPLTAICPQWLRLDGKFDKGGKFVVIPEAAAAIREAAKMVINQHTWKEIALHLNKNFPKTVGRKNEWTSPGLITILRKRQLIGEYQPAVRKKKRAIPTGDPVANYYPSILDGKTFRQVQKVIEDRRNGGGGRIDETINIWSGKMFDVQEMKVHITDHGNGRRYKSAGRVNGTSDMTMTPLYEVDRGLIFGLVNHISLNEIQPTADADELHKELLTVEKRIEKLAAQLGQMESDPAVVVRAIDKLQQTKGHLIKSIAAVEVPPESSELLARMKDALKSMDSIEDVETRRKLKAIIPSIVDKVHVHFVREWRDHIVSAVFHLIDGTEVDWVFRIVFKSRGVYSIVWPTDQAAVA